MVRCWCCAYGNYGTCMHGTNEVGAMRDRAKDVVDDSMAGLPASDGGMAKAKSLSQNCDRLLDNAFLIYGLVFSAT